MKLKYIIAFFPALLALSSCDLNEDTSGFSTSGNFYKTHSQCVAALNSCYMPLKSLYTGTMMIATEGATDLAYSRSATQDSDLDISPVKPRFGADVWQQCYLGIRYCNGAIAGIRDADIDDDDTKFNLLAEGMIMRAFYYWLLTSFFGDVPYYTDDVCDEATLHRISRLPRMSAIDTRNTLIEELYSFVPDMEQVRSSEVEENRAAAAMGWMLIAKMAAWNERWDDVLDACTQLESIYGDIGSYPLEDIPFRYKNTPESIFEIQHTYTAGGLVYTSTVACMCMPYPKSGSFYAGVDIPELGSNCTSWAPMQANNITVNDLFIVEEGDLRRDMCIVRGWNGVDFPDLSVSTAYFGPKFWCPNMQSNYDSNNYKVFRYADAILLKAEAYASKKEDMDIALEYLNKTRLRAGLEPFTRRSWAHITEEIRRERGRELFGEFQRKFDLVRWGIWYNATYANSRKSKLLENILPCHEYYPIPDTQVTYSGYVLDNNAYKAYGL